MEFNYEMDPTHLRTHEVNYELRIRGLTPTKAEITQRRKCLRETLRTEFKRSNLMYKTPNFDFNVEKAEVDNSVKTLQELVDEFDGTKEDIHKRFKSRYNHIIGRLQRFETEDQIEVAEYKNDKLVLVSSLSADVQDILEKCQPNTDMAIAATPAKSTPIFKWGITFDGSTKSCSVNSFLQRVEELRIARNTTKETLFKSAVDLFTGQGLYWYRSVKASIFDWDSLVKALKRDFLPIDYEDDLLEEIRARTQNKDEKITIYIATMENLFSRLSSKLKEEERLKIIKKNILPIYQVHIALHDFSSISQLAQICRKLENAGIATQSVKITPKKNIASLEPDLVGTSKIFRTANEFSRNVLRCWKCNKTGHKQKECKLQKKIYCHGCGKPDVIRPNCSCSKNVKTGNVL